MSSSDLQKRFVALQWAVTLGRYDIMVAVVTMGSFRAMPKYGHLNRLKRIVGYLKKNPKAAIRFRTGIPRHEEHYEPKSFDWSYSVYGDVKEEIPTDMPEPKGKPVRITTFVDANLMHDYVTGRSMTGILMLMNQTPVDFYAKKQGTVETAVFGSEFNAARIATEKVIDARHTLRYMGVPIEGKAWMFGDNEGVTKNSTVPHSVLRKRHQILSYHRVREAIAAGIIWFIHTAGKTNPADPMTKFLTWNEIKDKVGPFLFWKGETMEIPGIPPKVQS